MRMRLAILALGLTCLIAAGPQSLGRVALLGGWPSLAVQLLSDPAERGVALYRAGDHIAADAAFAQSRQRQTYNRALSLAATGQYALSVAYFDAVLYANPADAEARRNRELVAALAPEVVGDSIVPGRLVGRGGLAPAPASETNSAGFQDPEWKRPITARGMVANDDWLKTLPDDPGEFLILRLRAEYERRAALGLLRAPGAEPW